jgi:uncharacterized protein DUF1264
MRVPIVVGTTVLPVVGAVAIAPAKSLTGACAGREGTWGKTWHVWHTKPEPLPTGQATLMMGSRPMASSIGRSSTTAPAASRCRRTSLRKKRADIPAPR